MATFEPPCDVFKDEKPTIVATGIGYRIKTPGSDQLVCIYNWEFKAAHGYLLSLHIDPTRLMP